MNWKKYLITRLPVIAILISIAAFYNFPNRWIYLLGIYSLGLFDFSIFINKGSSKALSSTNSIIGFTGATLSFLGLLSMMKLSLFNSNIFDLDTSAIQYSVQGMVYIALSILGMYAVFSISISIRKRMTTDSTINMILLIIASCLFAGSYFLFPMYQSYTLLFYIVLILLLDWFCERYKSSLVYNFVWLGLLSAFMATYTFGLTIDKDRHDRHSIMSDMYNTHNIEQDEIIKSINGNLINSDAFKALAELDFQAKMNKADYSSFVKELLDIEDAVNCEAYDDNGEGVFSEQFIPFSEHLNKLYNSEKINQHIYFNPLTNGYTLYYKIKNKKRERPVHLFVTIGTYKTDTDIGVEYIVLKDKKNIANNLKGTLPTTFDNLLSVNRDMVKGDYAYVVETPKEGINILSFRKIAGINKLLSIFSFTILVAGILVFILILINKRTEIYPTLLSTDENNRTSLKGKIQFMVISMIIFSFIIIGIVTTYNFQNILSKNRRAIHEKELTTISNHISSITERAENNTDALFILENKLEEIENIYNIPMMIFDTNGNYLAGNKGNSYQMTNDEVKSVFDDQDINLKFDKGQWKTISVYSKDNKPFGFLSIGNDIEGDRGEILDFLSTILNIFVFLFMTAGAIAIFVSNSITKPIAKLGEKFKEFRLGRKTEQLEWKSNDEIGDLIKEYNNLTVKVQESAEIIAKTQRDSAWREMAKQVAHEIKNPLTPMKLSIQYLQYQMASNPSNGRELVAKTAKTMEEQINNLTQIANEFSNFAAMPRTENKVVVLNEIVEAVHDLFRKREDIDINLNEPLDDVIVYADHNHIVRILNNLVKNAIQAIPDGKRGVIDITLDGRDGNAFITVKDNGKGIPAHMMQKIFEPNFTTKSSGTGLGLAISANMIESFNGKLYCESEEHIGSTFYMEIPLMKQNTPQVI